MANSIVYGKYKLRQQGNNGTVVDLDADTIKMILVNATYAALSDATKHGHEFYSDVSSYEEAASGSYATGGYTLANKTSAQSAGTYTFDNTVDPAFTGYTGAPAGAITYKDTGVAATSPLVCYNDFGGTKTTSGGTLNLTINASGLFTY